MKFNNFDEIQSAINNHDNNNTYNDKAKPLAYYLL